VKDSGLQTEFKQMQCHWKIEKSELFLPISNIWYFRQLSHEKKSFWLVITKCMLRKRFAGVHFLHSQGMKRKSFRQFKRGLKSNELPLASVSMQLTQAETDANGIRNGLMASGIAGSTPAPKSPR
jgi:hypothetical protein